MTDIKGCGTALVTPFTSQRDVDLAAYRKLVEWQIESGIDFLVPCGTTGESVTLTEEEYVPGHSGLCGDGVGSGSGGGRSGDQRHALRCPTGACRSGRRRGTPSSR